MKLLVLKENLKTGLDIVSRITAKSFSLPILNNVLLSAEKNLLCLTATDLEMGINYWLLAKTEEQGKTTIPAKFLASLVSAFPADKLLLEEKNNVLNIEGQDFKAQIKGQSSDDFPIIPKIEKEDFIEVESVPFCRGLGLVVDHAALSQTRPEIAGIYLSFQKNQIIMAATDSFRLAEKKLFYNKKPTESLLENKPLILPQKTVRQLLSVVSEKTKKIKIYFSANQIMFEVGREEGSQQPEFQIVSRLIEGEYPNYQEIIPKEHKTQIVLPKQKLLEHLKTASLFAGRIYEVKFFVDPKKQVLEVFSQSQEVGESRSRVAARIKGEPVSASFNWRFLIDGLAGFGSQEVSFELNGEEGPAVIRPVGDSSFIYIAMPIKGT